MIVDVPVQVVDAPSIQSQVLVIPSANWQHTNMRAAGQFVLSEDPESFQVLEWEDVEPASIDQAAVKGGVLGKKSDGSKKGFGRGKNKGKKRAVISRVAKPAASGVCKCKD